MNSAPLPRLLVLDDLYGRVVPNGRNIERENLCAHFLWRDVTDDVATRLSPQKVLRPAAEVVFHRAQHPTAAIVGTTVENDVLSALEVVREGFTRALEKGEMPWTLVLIDLCFYTGEVTQASHRHASGMPQGRATDGDPARYFGLTLLQEIHRRFPELPLFLLSSKAREEVSLEFSERGALGLIARDATNGPDLLANALRNHGLLADPSGEIVGHSLPVLLALREARRATALQGNLFIRGERGTGKELLASYAHRDSAALRPQDRCPLVAVNSAVLHSDLFSSELFGIEPRTASGVEGKIGLVETADGGDLFLDEIADLPAEVQASLLRVLQEGRITRVGSRESRPVEVRFLSATNLDLEAAPKSFRTDLLDRLRTGGTLWLPPLRERKVDIPALVTRFVREAETRRPGTLRREIQPQALERLQAHDWPGNIRELRSCVFDAVNRFPDVEHLVAGHLRLPESASSRVSVPTSAASSESTPERMDLSTLILAQHATTFPQSEVDAWSGRFKELQDAQNKVCARYLQAALQATRRRTPSHPSGQVQIHPAMKLLTGDTGLSASRAADMIKRMLGPIELELEGDLKEALTIAIRLRPRGAKLNSSEG